MPSPARAAKLLERAANSDRPPVLIGQLPILFG